MDCCELRWEEHGLFTNSDQDRLLYVFAKGGLLGNVVKVVPFTEFNSRVYHYTNIYNQYFICHFSGFANKTKPLRHLQKQFSLNSYLLPRSAKYNADAFRGSMFVESNFRDIAVMVAKWLKNKIAFFT
jgi:hypothetical protein